MNIESTLLQQLPDLQSGEPCPCKIRDKKERKGPSGGRKRARQSKHTTEDRRSELPLPLIQILLNLVDLHLPGNQLWKRQGSPMPESWGRRTGDARECGGLCTLRDLNLRANHRMRGTIALGTIALSGEQAAWMLIIAEPEALQHSLNPLVERGILRLAQSGDGNRLVPRANRDRFNVGLRLQDLSRTLDQTTDRLRLGGFERAGFHCVASGASPLHGTLTSEEDKIGAIKTLWDFQH